MQDLNSPSRDQTCALCSRNGGVLTTGRTTREVLISQWRWFLFLIFLIYFIYLFSLEANYFTILYWFCHMLTWTCHGCTRVPHPEPPSHLSPYIIPLGHPSAPALRIPYHALNLDFTSLILLCPFSILSLLPHSEPPSHLPPHPILQGHPSAPALSTLPHASTLDWRSISHMIIYMFQCYSLKSSHPYLLPQSQQSVLYFCVSFAVLHIGSSLPSF